MSLIRTLARAPRAAATIARTTAGTRAWSSGVGSIAARGAPLRSSLVRMPLPRHVRSCATAANTFLVLDESNASLDDIIKKPGAKVLVYFTATQHFKTLSSEFGSSVTFVKVDVDDNAATAGEASISAVPTFHAYKGGERTEAVVGSNATRLREVVAQLAAA